MRTSERLSVRRFVIGRPLAGLTVAALPFLIWSCERSDSSPPTELVRVLIPSPSPRSMAHYESYAELVAPQIRISPQPTDGSVVVVNELQAGRGEIGVAQADVVYSAYRKGIGNNRTPHTNLRAIAVLGVNNFYVFVHRDSDIHRFEQLEGRRVAVPGKGSAGEVFTRTVLEAHNMSYADLDVDFQPSSEQSTRFMSGNFDATVMVGPAGPAGISIPIPRDSLRLLPISAEVITRLRAEFPFITPVTVLANALPALRENVGTIGVDSLLICRADLSEDLVYNLTRAFFAHPPMLRAYFVDADDAPATPIPTHAGAARYYREREILK